VRFATQLDFVIEDETFKAVIALANRLSSVSRERIRDEVLKILITPKRVRGLELLEGTGLLTAISLELFEAVTRKSETWFKAFQLLHQTERDQVLLFTLFLWPLFERQGDTWRSTIATALKSLRLDNRISDEILFCFRNSGRFMAPETVRRGEMALLLAHPAARIAERIALLIEEASGVVPVNLADRKSYLADLRRVTLRQDGEKPHPLISGDDAQDIGFKPGPQLGGVLHEAYLLQLEGRFADRSAAMLWLKNQYSLSGL
jgi:tRNA nucleotidyltransferase/poly(A) polymerase